MNDAFSHAWLGCFDDVGRMIMRMSADELEALRVCNKLTSPSASLLTRLISHCCSREAKRRATTTSQPLLKPLAKPTYSGAGRRWIATVSNQE